MPPASPPRRWMCTLPSAAGGPSVASQRRSAGSVCRARSVASSRQPSGLSCSLPSTCSGPCPSSCSCAWITPACAWPAPAVRPAPCRRRCVCMTACCQCACACSCMRPAALQQRMVDRHLQLAARLAQRRHQPGIQRASSARDAARRAIRSGRPAAAAARRKTPVAAPRNRTCSRTWPSSARRDICHCTLPQRLPVGSHHLRRHAVPHRALHLLQTAAHAVAARSTASPSAPAETTAARPRPAASTPRPIRHFRNDFKRRFPGGAMRRT